jgi:hypothetical protein
MRGRDRKQRRYWERPEDDNRVRLPPAIVERVVQDVLHDDRTLQRIFRGVGTQQLGAQVAGLLRMQGVLGAAPTTTVYEALIRVLYARALNGNMSAARLLMDRLLPTTSRIELAPSNPAQGLSDEELDAEIRRMEGPCNGQAPITVEA